MDQESPIFDVQVSGTTVVVVPRECLTEFDFAQIETEGKRVLAWMEQQPTVNVLLDLKNSDYFGSSAIGFFMKLWKRARTRKGHMAVCNTSAHALELIRLIQADKLWHLCESPDQGLAWLASQ